MNRRTKAIPKYRRQRIKGRPDRAFVELDGRRVHLPGEYGSEGSRRAYQRALAESSAAARCAGTAPSRLTIARLLDAFTTYLERYYADSGEPQQFKLALAHVAALYADTCAVDFGPRRLKAVRSRMVAGGWGRRYANQQVGRVKRMFKWAASEELLPGSIYETLRTVDGLKRGRTDAKESPGVKPVPDAFVEAVRGHVSAQVWAMIQVQVLTACRPGEACIMRPIDLDTTGKVWLYRPASHKGAWREHDRTIYVGPQAQKAVRSFLEGRAVEAFMFSPAEAEAARRERRRAERVTPKHYGNSPGTHRSRNPQRHPRDRYDTVTYAQAIRRGCKAAGIDPWSPGRLRHNAGTALRKAFGLEAASLLLGHRRCDVTQVYAEVNEARALEIALRVG